MMFNYLLRMTLTFYNMEHTAYGTKRIRCTKISERNKSQKIKTGECNRGTEASSSLFIFEEKLSVE